jgi:glycosyltransferase involved in cell wall biosynthesis
MRSVLLSASSLDVGNGGPSQNIPMLAIALKKQGLRVAVASAQPGKFHAALGENEVPVFVGSRGTAGISHFFDKALKSFCPDLVHDNGIWLRANHIVASTCTNQSIPLVVSPRGMLEPWALRYRGLKKRLAWSLYQRRDLRCAACVVATSDEERLNVLSLLHESNVAVVPNGWVAPATCQRHTRQPNDLRKVLFLSRIHPKKGIELLLEAWGQLRPIDWRLEIVGPGESSYVNALKEFSKTLGVQATVSFLAPIYDVDEKNTAIASADLVILPSYSENFGSIIVEALGLGVPVITTTGTPWREMAERNAGWWVAPTVSAIAAALRESMALSDEVRSSMGHRGRQWILSRFSWDSVALRMMKVYEQVLARRN